MSNYLILVAGGSGSRMGKEIPKQFIDLNHQPVITWSIQTFLKADPQIKIIIAIHPSWKNHLQDVLKKYFAFMNIEVVDGGETRFHSVKNALNKINETGTVLIHDAARPLVSVETISRCVAAVRTHKNAIPVLKISESLRIADGDNSHPVNRDQYRIVQTPQCFDIKLLKEAFHTEYLPEFTDDASVFEKAGHQIHLVDGNPENIKITVPSDLIMAELFLKNKMN